MKTKFSSFTPQENLISILPSIVAGILVLVTTVSVSLIYFPPQQAFTRNVILFFGIVGSIYLAFYYILFSASVNKSRFTWSNVIISSATLSTLAFVIPNELDHMLYALVFIASLSTSLISTRAPAYSLVIGFTSIYIISRFNTKLETYDWVIHGSQVIAAFMVIETIQQLKKMAREQINKLEIINELSKQIVSTLDMKQVFTLLNAAFQNALEADSYFIGVVEGEEIRLELLYDGGEYFHNVKLPRRGTFSSWVIDNQRELFLPDLRQKIVLEGVDVVLVGQNQTSLSWVGVPMRGTHVDGIMAIASYQPNAFDRGDVELLFTIAQRAALALDNAHHHAIAEEQARLDSLTHAYNHGYFLKLLNQQAQECLDNQQPLSLIMLDIDFFKQYNDTYGHIVGDEVLVSLCRTIQMHIKSTDAVGRWGGEEFVIFLPNADGIQATQIAQRIRESLAAHKIQNNEHANLPIPTISMGIAVFPTETDQTTKLIDLADNRLYKAKERGRDQIEPTAAFWEELNKSS